MDDDSSEAFDSIRNTSNSDLGKSVASADGIGESVPDSSSEISDTEAQVGQPIGIGQTLRERYAQGIINARPAARKAAALARSTNQDQNIEIREKNPPPSVEVFAIDSGGRNCTDRLLARRPILVHLYRGMTCRGCSSQSQS